MGRWKLKLQEPVPVRLYLAIASNKKDLIQEARKDCLSIFGRSDYEMEPDISDPVDSIYDLSALDHVLFLSFVRPVGREQLVDIRRRCLGIESKYTDKESGRPLVEIDPGYVAEQTVVRSSLEDGFSNVYLYAGIFGQPIYFYERFNYRSFMHTPEYYRNPEVITVFNDLRLISIPV